jgi:hypothetical protein
MSVATSSLVIIQPSGPHHAAASPIDTGPSSIAAMVISGVTGAKLFVVVEGTPERTAPGSNPSVEKTPQC